MIHWLVTADLRQLKINILYFKQHYIFKYYALFFTLSWYSEYISANRNEDKPSEYGTVLLSRHLIR